MKSERWHEIVRLYYAALERKPEERAAFFREECRGDESLRKVVESLVACRPQAEKFMESPALETAEGTLAERQQVESVAGGAQRIHAVRGKAGPRTGRQLMPPWWILILSIPFAASASFLYFWLLFFGPEPAGWMVQVDNRAGSEGWNRIATVLPASPAANAGFQSGDLISSKDLDQFRTQPHADQLQFQVKRLGESAELTLTLKRKGREYRLSPEGVRALLLVVDSALCLILAGTLEEGRHRCTGLIARPA